MSPLRKFFWAFALAVLQEREPKRGAGAVMRHHLQSTPMVLHDGTTDCESHSHATGLRRVECLEDAVRVFRVDSDA